MNRTRQSHWRSKAVTMEDIMFHKTTLLTALFILATTTPALAQGIDTRERIDVSGSAQIKLVPDEFVIRARVDTYHKNLDTAVARGDKSVSAAFTAVKKLGVARRYIVTDRLDMNAVLEDYRSSGIRGVEGYRVSRDLMVILHDPELVEPAMKAMFGAGVHSMSVEMGHTKSAEHLAAARADAAKDAKARAGALAAALGRKVGRAVYISQGSSGPSRPSNFVYHERTPDLGDSLSLGKITLATNVTVTFLLE